MSEHRLDALVAPDVVDHNPFPSRAPASTGSGRRSPSSSRARPTPPTPSRTRSLPTTGSSCAGAAWAPTTASSWGHRDGTADRHDGNRHPPARRRRQDRRDEVAQQPVEPAHAAAPFLGELVAAVGEEAQDRGVVVGRDAAQPAGVVRRDDGDAGGVDAVGLAAVAGLQQPGPSGQGGRHVDDRLADADQSLGEEAPEPVGAFDGPGPLRPVGRPGEQLGQRGLVGSARTRTWPRERARSSRAAAVRPAAVAA